MTGTIARAALPVSRPSAQSRVPGCSEPYTTIMLNANPVSVGNQPNAVARFHVHISIKNPNSSPITRAHVGVPRRARVRLSSRAIAPPSIPIRPIADTTRVVYHIAARRDRGRAL